MRLNSNPHPENKAAMARPLLLYELSMIQRPGPAITQQTSSPWLALAAPGTRRPYWQEILLCAQKKWNQVPPFDYLWKTAPVHNDVAATSNQSFFQGHIMPVAAAAAASTATGLGNIAAGEAANTALSAAEMAAQINKKANAAAVSAI
ncbi:hypothetical protein AAKU55_003612 [Oxalobacteraceae bacterium GrIS 1.11]